MFHDLQITIPSRSRYTSQKTIYNLSESLWPSIILVVPHDQYITYRQNIPLDIVIQPFGGNGIGNKREFMLRLKPTGKIIMMDDDLTFYARVSISKFVKLDKNSEESVHMVTDIYNMLDKYVAVGLVDKFMSQARPRGSQECQRYNQVLGYNRDSFPNPWPSFRIAHDEEHDVHLQLLTRGFRTAISTEWSKSDKPNAQGGCSDWRSDVYLQEIHGKLLELWPDIVSITANPNRARYNWKRAKEIGGLK